MANFYTEQYKESAEKLFEAILTLETVEDCHKFFEDICTIKELQEISQRWAVACMLDKGSSYQEVSKETGASTATISRVKRSLDYGSDGYRIVFERMNQKKEDNNE